MLGSFFEHNKTRKLNGTEISFSVTHIFCRVDIQAYTLVWALFMDLNVCKNVLLILLKEKPISSKRKYYE